MALDKEFLDSYFKEHTTSLLFPLYAEQLLQNNDLERAAEICADGLLQFPHLATGWIVYAQVALAQEKYTDAKSYLLRSLEEDRGSLSAAELLLTIENFDLSEPEKDGATSALLDLNSEYTPNPETMEKISLEEEIEAEAATTDDTTEYFPETTEEIDEELGTFSDKTLSADESEDVLDTLELEEDQVIGEGEYLEEDFTEEADVDEDEVPAQEGEEDEILEEVFQEAAEEEPEFEPPDFEGEVIEEEEAEDFEEEFDLEDLEQESGRFEDLEEEKLEELQEEEFSEESAGEQEFELSDIEDLAEEPEESVEESEASEGSLKRRNVDFAEIAHQESERAPEAIEGRQLSREQIESMSKDELLSILKQKYGLEEESESTTAFLNRLNELEDVDQEIRDALEKFDIFKIDDEGETPGSEETVEDNVAAEFEDIETPEETVTADEEEIEQTLEGESEIDLEDLDLELEEESDDADIDLSEEEAEIDEFEELAEEPAETSPAPEDEISDEVQDLAESEEESPDEAEEELTIEVPIEEPPEENLAENVKPRPAHSNEAKLTITPRMATFTFADVLRKQGLYEQAYEVLEMMRDKSPNIERIEREQEKLQELMSGSGSDSD